MNVLVLNVGSSTLKFQINELPAGQLVMLKLTLPERDDFYADCVRHPNVLRMVALSGGYTREEANERLRRNHGIVASFSRALVEENPFRVSLRRLAPRQAMIGESHGNRITR